MKKIVLLMFMCISVLAVHAQLLFEENFDYPSGALEGQGGVSGKGAWYVCKKSGENGGASPQIVAGSLNYSGYKGKSETAVAKLDPAIGATSADQRITTRFVIDAAGDTAKYSEMKKVYVAFLVNVGADSKTSADRDFFDFEASLTSSSTRGRVFAKVSTAGKVTFGISKNASTPTSFPEVDCGKTNLMVLVYTYNESDPGGATGNDIIELFLNPDPLKTEAEQASSVKLTAADNTTVADYGASAGVAINLRQRGISALIGGIRLGSTWESVVEGQGSDDGGNYTSKEIIHEQFNATPWTDQALGNYTVSVPVGTGTGNMLLENCSVETTKEIAGASSVGRIILQKTDSKTAAGVLEFPQVTSCGKVTVNANTGSVSKTFKLQKKNGANWDDLATFTTPSETLSETSSASACASFSYDVNSATPVTVRLINNTSSTLYFYEVWMTDYVKDNSPINWVIVNKGEVVSSRYYTITGMEVREPQKGLYIKKDLYEDGSLKTSKVFINHQ